MGRKKREPEPPQYVFEESPLLDWIRRKHPTVRPTVFRLYRIDGEALGGARELGGAVMPNILPRSFSLSPYGSYVFTGSANLDSEALRIIADKLDELNQEKA